MADSDDDDYGVPGLTDPATIAAGTAIADDLLAVFRRHDCSHGAALIAIFMMLTDVLNRTTNPKEALPLTLDALEKYARHVLELPLEH